jgi:hypothetical protein
MRQVIFFRRRKAQFSLRFGSGALALATALASCSSGETPLAIRMYNPETNQTLHCTARSETSANNPALAFAVEACARQLEAKGFVRDK